MILIGIDPGKHTGVAFWDKSERQLLSVYTTDFWGIITILQKVDKSKVRVHIENPAFIKPTFKRGGKLSEAVKNSISQKVGMNKEHGKLIIEFCKRNKIECIPMKPKKENLSKMPEEKFKKYTGWKGVTSQHARDAAMLVYGF